MVWRPFIFLIGSSLVVGPSTALDQIKNKKNGAPLSSNAGAPPSARAALMRSEWDPTNGIEIAKGHMRTDKLSLFPSGASSAGEPDDAAQAMVPPANANTHKDVMRIGTLAAKAASSPQLGGHAGEVQEAAPAEKAASTTETIGRKNGSIATGSGALMQAANASSFSSAHTPSGSQQARSTLALILPNSTVKVKLTVFGVSFAVLSRPENRAMLADFGTKMQEAFPGGYSVAGLATVELSPGPDGETDPQTRVVATMIAPRATTADSLKQTLEAAGLQATILKKSQISCEHRVGDHWRDHRQLLCVGSYNIFNNSGYLGSCTKSYSSTHRSRPIYRIADK